MHSEEEKFLKLAPESEKYENILLQAFTAWLEKQPDIDAHTLKELAVAVVKDQLEIGKSLECQAALHLVSIRGIQLIRGKLRHIHGISPDHAYTAGQA
jgi:hypothetical protein